MTGHEAPDPGVTHCSWFERLAVISACLLITLAAIATYPGAPAKAAPLALVFAPWLDRQTVVERGIAAGYRVLRTGTLDTILVVAAPEAAPAPPLPDGAWFALAIDGLAGCLDVSTADSGA
ncbi:MAG: hypothetical protein ACK4VM_05475 [Bosea sp. (in: a-proteobacteria)]